MSNTHHKHRDERNANKRICLVHIIQKNPSTMVDNDYNDHLAITLVNFHEKYLLAE